MDLSVIIVNYNTEGLLERAIGALRQSAHGLDVDITVIDNASKDGSVELIRNSFQDCRLIANEINVGFGRANNQALPYLTGRYVLLLNTDAFVESDTITKTVAYMDAHPRCGILGVKLLSRDGTLQPSARFFPTPVNLFLARSGLNRIFRNARMVDDMSWDHSSVRQCDWVPGCYYLIRKEVIDAVGLFDPRYFLYYEEIDHCRATKQAGWDVTFFPYTSTVHIGGESARSAGKVTKSGSQIDALRIESELLYFRKHYGVYGIFLNVLLTMLGDSIILIKRVIRLRFPLGIRAFVSHNLLVFSLLRRTEWGTRPTR